MMHKRGFDKGEEGVAWWMARKPILMVAKEMEVLVERGMYVVGQRQRTRLGLSVRGHQM